jgi:hypothetical protein
VAGDTGESFGRAAAEEGPARVADHGPVVVVGRGGSAAHRAGVVQRYVGPESKCGS